MNKLLTSIAVCLMSLVMISSSSNQHTIFIIGDSTAANKKDINGQERGWGMALQGFFTENIRVDNHALNGRSSRSFILEGHWQKVYDAMKPGDYLVIQFGHNDEKGHVGDKRHTDPGTTFDDNYRMFCRKAIEKGAKPIVMNAVVRRNFLNNPDNSIDDEALRNLKSADGKEYVNSDTLIDTHGAYILTPKFVARELRVPYVDANKITKDYENSLGVQGSRKLHMISSSDKSKDNTHYTVYGAHQVAGLLVDAIAEVCPELKPFVRHYDYVVSATGFGNYLTLQEAIDAVPQGASATISVLDGTFPKPVFGKSRKIKILKFSGVKIQN